MKTLYCILSLLSCSCSSTEILIPDKFTFGHNLDNETNSIGFHWNLDFE